MEKIVLPEIENLHQIAVYENHGGYEAIKKALSQSPDDIIEQVKKCPSGALSFFMNNEEKS